MRAAFLSDAHACGRDDPNQQELVLWLDALQVDELFLLGDIFHHWWGFDSVVWAPYVPLCAALERVSARGVGITFVPGNHDFVVGAYLRDSVGLVVRPPHTRDLDGVRVFMAHGDEADSSPAYALTRWALRSRPFAMGMRVLGPRRGHEVLRALAGGSRHYGLRQADAAGASQLDAQLQAQRDWAQQWLDQGADLAVMGHLHRPLVVPLGDGTMVHLGDWVHHRTWLSLVDGHATLRQGLEGALWSE